MTSRNSGLTMMVTGLIGLTGIQPVFAQETQINIRNPGANLDIDCVGKKIVVSGANNDLRLTNCPNIVISGASNNVVVNGATAVDVPGANNSVRANYESDGWVQVNGSTNQVEVIAARPIKVRIGNRGTDNRLVRRFE